MIKTLHRVLKFLKKPEYVSYAKAPNFYKRKLFAHLLLLSFAMAFVSVFLMGVVVEGIFNLDLGNHAVEELFLEHSVVFIFFIAVVIAPLLEELIFRGGLSWFKHKSYFKGIFYLSAVLFALVHISNFESQPMVYLLAPILVLPQLILGLILGYIRVRLGLLWSILLHASYNGLLMLPLLVAKSFWD